LPRSDLTSSASAAGRPAGLSSISAEPIFTTTRLARARRARGSSGWAFCDMTLAPEALEVFDQILQVGIGFGRDGELERRRGARQKALVRAEMFFERDIDVARGFHLALALEQPAHRAAARPVQQIERQPNRGAGAGQ